MDQQNFNPQGGSTNNNSAYTTPEKKSHASVIIIIVLSFLVLIGLFIAFYQRGKYLTTEFQETGTSTVREESTVPPQQPTTNTSVTGTTSTSSKATPSEDLTKIDAELNTLDTASLDQ